MYTKFCCSFCEINVLGNTSPFLTYDRFFVKLIVYKMGKAHFRKTGVVLI